MNEQVRRVALPLTLPALATQWLNVGQEKVFLLPHVPVLLAYRQVHPRGND